MAFSVHNAGAGRQTAYFGSQLPAQVLDQTKKTVDLKLTNIWHFPKDLRWTTILKISQIF